MANERHISLSLIRSQYFIAYPESLWRRLRLGSARLYEYLGYRNLGQRGVYTVSGCHREAVKRVGLATRGISFVAFMSYDGDDFEMLDAKMLACCGFLLLFVLDGSRDLDEYGILSK